MMVTGGRSRLVRAGYTLGRAGYTLIMRCHVDGTWNEQGDDCVGYASVIAMAPGSAVTSYSNENPSITPFFLIAYLE
jgi:hypothetical protein